MNTGIVLVAVGVVFVLLGLLWWSGALSWFGHLPGDVRMQRDSFAFYMPITSMILVSIALSVIVSLLRRLF